ncbi:hypothetical protein I317_02687 [Kwoniella heveanensis CBS 569]|nr:hypothetical protein I317_02687 [Kwoniella heveanensis CBS 569]
MEAVRPYKPGLRTVHAGDRGVADDEVDTLPPPPEPFPKDQLDVVGRAESSSNAAMAQPRQHLRSYLLSVQQTCVNALSSLVDSNATSARSSPPLDEQTQSSSSPLGPDTQLAAALTDLLEVTYELDDLLPPTPIISANITPTTVHSATFIDERQEGGGTRTDGRPQPTVPGYGDGGASFDALTQVLVGLHEARSAEAGAPDQANSSNVDCEDTNRDYGVRTQNGTDKQGLHPAINVVREELAWERLESLTTAVLELSRHRGERAEDGHSYTNGFCAVPDQHDSTVNEDDRRHLIASKSHQSGHGDTLPPSYEQYHGHRHPQQHDSDNASLLPSYSDIKSHLDGEQDSLSVEKGKPAQEHIPSVSRETTQRGSEPVSPHQEKMLHELDAVTSAIERLASIAPRLHDQRVEMRHSHDSSSSASSKQNGLTGVAKASDSETTSKEERIKLERIKMRELEEIWDKIERAHGKRRIRIEDGQRVEGAGWERRRRDRFMDKIVDQSEATRMEDQDSVMGTVNAKLARARDLRDRDHFLRELIDQSGERRLNEQDAEGSELDILATQREKQNAFVSEIVSKTRASRLTSQDFPSTVEDRLAERRASYIESLMNYSSSGRLHDQDSMPPTPRRGINGEKEEDPFEMVTVQDFLASGGPVRRSSLAADRLGLLRNSGSSSGASTPTGLKKLTGMMRRGSGHLGIRPNTFDVNSVSYIAEHQENLRSVQITLHGVGISSNLDLQLETPSPAPPGAEDEAVIISKKDPAFTLRITLPTPVIPGQIVAFTPQALHLEAKIVAQPTPPSAVSLLPTYALSASHLKAYNAKALCCAACETELATLPTRSPLVDTEVNSNFEGAYKDLPSEHWAEMMEVWMCHNDPTFTARLAEKTKEGFWPQNGGVLVGGSYLLVGQERIKAGTIRVDEMSQAETWKSISCVCGEPVGKQRAADDKPGSNTVRFSKWAISLLKEDDELSETVEHIRFTLSVFVVSDMLELAQAHASHRFIIANEESGEKRLYVWLFNPSVKMSYRRHISTSSPLPSPLRSSHALPASQKSKTKAGDADSIHNSKPRRSSAASFIGIGSKHPAQGTVPRTTSGGKVIRAAKIMYKVVNSVGDDDDNHYDDLPGFGPGGQIETLSYSTTACDGLISTLRESTGVYPLSKRSMGRFDIGFLERV